MTSVSIPGSAGGFSYAPLKAAAGSLARPRKVRHLKVTGSTPEPQLVKARILLFLIMASSRPDRAHEISPGPKMLPNGIALALLIDPRQMDGALSLDGADNLGHG